MAGRYEKGFAQAVEAGLDNCALAIEEERVGDAVVFTAEATERLVCRAITDGVVTRHEVIAIRTALAVLREGLRQIRELDRTDAQVARTLCGALEATAKKRASGELAHGCLVSSR